MTVVMIMKVIQDLILIQIDEVKELYPYCMQPRKMGYSYDLN